MVSFPAESMESEDFFDENLNVFDTNEHETVGRESLDPLIINTNSHCFVCLRCASTNSTENKNSSIKIEPDSPQQPDISSLRSICRFLNINIKGVLDNAGLEDYVDRLGNFSVNLCDQCMSLVTKLNNLCLELELLQMKVDDGLMSLNEILKDAGEDVEKIGINTTDGIFANHLRSEIISKSDDRLNTLFPRVTVERQAARKITERIIPGNLIVNPSRPILLRHESSFHTITPNQQEQEIAKPEPTCTSVTAPSKRTLVKEKWIDKVSACTLCRPPRPIKLREMRRHNIHIHLETLFIPQKLPHLSSSQFREYCEHVMQVEVISSKTRQNAEGNPVCQCTHCPNAYTNYRALRYHIFADHKEILDKKLVALQHSSTLEDIRAIQLPRSCFSKDDMWKCVGCGMTFTHESSMYKHRRQNENTCGVVHGPIKKRASGSHRCGSCTMTFKLLRNLRRHQKLVHGPSQEKRDADLGSHPEFGAVAWAVEEDPGSVSGEGQQEEIFRQGGFVLKMEHERDAIFIDDPREYLVAPEESMQSEMWNEGGEEMIIPDISS